MSKSMEMRVWVENDMAGSLFVENVESLHYVGRKLVKCLKTEQIDNPSNFIKAVRDGEIGKSCKFVPHGLGDWDRPPAIKCVMLFKEQDTLNGVVYLEDLDADKLFRFDLNDFENALIDILKSTDYTI